MQKTRKKNTRNKSVFAITIWSVLFIWAAVFIFLMLWALVASIKDFGFYWLDAVGFPTKKEEFAWDNYWKAFTLMQVYTSKFGFQYFGNMLYNSLFYVIMYGLLNVASPMLCSYIYAKYNKRVKWVRILWIIVLINLYVPLSASLASSLNFSMKLGLYDNIYTYMLGALNGFGGNFLIYYATWKGLSWEYAEAAFIDGASNTRVMTQIMIPMTKTIFGVLFLTQVVALWTDYSTPMVFLPSYPTLAYGVFLFQSSVENGASFTPVRIASLIAVAAPMILLFIAFKNKMMGSLTIGGLKG